MEKSVKEKFYQAIQDSYSSFEELEKERKKAWKELAPVLIIGMLILLSCFGKIIWSVANCSFSENFQNWVIVIFPTAMYVIFDLIQTNRNFVKKLKTVCMPRLLEAFGCKKWDSHSNKLDTTKLVKSKLFSEFSHHISDDIIEGCYKTTKYQIVDLTLLYGSNKSRSQVFKGVVITFPFNKKIKSPTIVATKSDGRILNRMEGFVIGVICISLVTFVGFYLGINEGMLNMLVWGICALLFLLLLVVCYILDKMFFQPNNKLKRIQLEDPLWEKKFNVFSKNEVEARYLVTTAFMERFLNLTTAFGTKKAKCSFINGEIVFAISSKKDLFEIGNLFTPLTDHKFRTDLFDELASILDMIEYFKLNEDSKI